MKLSIARLHQRLIAFGLNPSEWNIEIFGHTEGLFDVRLTSRIHEFVLEGRASLNDWIWLRMLSSDAA
jgi:hypothetical protein